MPNSVNANLYISLHGGKPRHIKETLRQLPEDFRHIKETSRQLPETFRHIGGTSRNIGGDSLNIKGTSRQLDITPRDEIVQKTV